MPLHTGRPVTATPHTPAPAPPGAGAGALRIRVFGTPAPQGSKHAFAARGKGGVPTGRIGVIESGHDRVKSWRADVVNAAFGAMAAAGQPPAALSGPVSLSVSFYLRRPKDHFGRGANSAVLRPAAPRVPGAAPDLSKLIRSTEDALTSAGVWGDDGQVAAVTACKLYATPGELPGADITIGAL